MSLTGLMTQLVESAPFAQVQFGWSKDNSSEIKKNKITAYYFPPVPTSPLAIFLSLLALSKDELKKRTLPNPGSLLLTLGVKDAFVSLVWKMSEAIG